jgi:hypothetical protein
MSYEKKSKKGEAMPPHRAFSLGSTTGGGLQFKHFYIAWRMIPPYIRSKENGQRYFSCTSGGDWYECITFEE